MAPRIASAADALGDAIEASITNNPQLAADLDTFVAEAIRDARQTLRTGTPDARMALQRLVLEGAIKASARKSDESIVRLEREFHDFRRQMMAEVAAPVAGGNAPVPAAKVDAPRGPLPVFVATTGKLPAQPSAVRAPKPVTAPTPTPHQRAADFLARQPRAPGPRPR